MRKKNLQFRLLSLLGVAICLPQMLLLAQSNEPRSGRTPTDSMMNVMADTVKGRIVRLPYSTVAASKTAASYDVVYHKDIIKSQVTNVLNALTGRLSGVYTEQFSGQPGSDGVNFSLRGRSPIVLIDGVARNLTTLDLEEVESVTVLKDAVATAMLGVRGANGAVMITTRRGIPGQPTISFTAQSSVQQPLNLPRTLNSYNYAVLRNEAIDNDLRANPSLASSLNRLRFTDADIQAYNTNSDPLGRPNVDWQSQILRKTSMFNRYSFNASGGNNFTRYFVAIEHFKQEGLFKEDDANAYSTNNFLKGYLARTNVEINITPKLSGGIALLGRIINGNEPAGSTNLNAPGGTGSIFNAILATPNSAYPVYNSDGTFGANQNYTMPSFSVANQTQASNLQALSTGSGYLQSYRRDILADFFLRRTLNEILPGLWVKARLSYSSFLTENINRTKGYIAYRTNGASLTPIGLRIDQINTNGIGAQGRSNYSEVSAGYAHTFSRLHDLDVLFLANRDQALSGSDLPYTVTGTSGRVAYTYNQRYTLEASYGLNGSNRYEGGETNYGFFPAIGASWNITNESFAKNMGWLNGLKLFASYGKLGNDNPGYFTYLQRYPGFTQPVFGTAATGQASLIQGTLANPDITFEKANKFNVGVQGSVAKTRLSFSAEYYNNKYYDLLITRGRNTSLLGTTYPTENVGVQRYTGMDFQLAWHQNIGKFQYFIAGNAGIQQSEVIYQDEVNQPFDYMRRTGQRVGRPFGYIADGIFQSAAEIQGAAIIRNNILPQPGDVKYRDLNNDGEINQLDVTAIGTDKPLTTYGITLGFTFKALDFSALVQGVANRNIFTNNNRFFEFQNGGLAQAFEENLDRWTPSNPSATNPRLSIGGNSNNREFSSLYVKSGDYIRLKNLEIGYTPQLSILRRARLKSVRVFANGLNLLTATKVKNIDPEVYNGSYPIQRLFNFGVNIKF